MTTLVTGEINRADGLADVVVGIAESARAGSAGGLPALSPATAQVLVFEGPEGALRHEPELIALPATATALALGQLDDSYEMDLAVAAGSELVVVHGRDRKLSLDAESRSEVAPASIDREAMPFAITSMVLGDFVGDYRTEVALLSGNGVVHVLERAGKDDQWGKIISEVATGSRSESAGAKEAGSETATEAGRMPALPVLVRARVSVSGKDDVVVVHRGHHQLHIVSDGVQSTDFSRALSDSKMNPTEVGTLNIVANLDVEGEPMAVLPMRLNKDALSDLVILKGGGAAPLTISSSAVVSTFVVNSTGNDSDANTGDGKCETVLNNGICTLRAAIQQANASAGDDAITFSVSSITIASGASILPTIFQPVTLDGGAGRVVISGSGLGVSASNCTIRGLVINRYPFSGGPAIGISGSSNFIEGNYIGTDVTGANADFGSSPNWTGISTSGASPNNTIGGTTLAARNVISTPGTGVQMLSGSSGIKVQGNYIGTDATGTKALGRGVLVNSPTQ